MALTLNYDWITLNAQPAGTYGPFVLAGGLYGITTVLGASATVTLEILGPDGATMVPVAPQESSTTTYETAYLPPGSYYVVIGTATSSVAVQRIRL